MTKGELRFYLREIHSYWCAPRIAEERIADLEREKLIERAVAPLTGIRLTSDGVREKTAGRHRHSNSSLSLTRTPERSKRRPARAPRPTQAQKLS